MSGFKLNTMEQNIEIDKDNNQIGVKPRDDFLQGSSFIVHPI